MTDLITVLSLALKIAMMIIDKATKTPAENRRASLDDLDKAIEKAKVSGDMSDVSNWMGKRL